MAKTKMILIALACLVFTSCGQMYRWETIPMDGSRTGCTAATADNVPQALGVVTEEGTYLSPSGNTFKAGTATADVASIVLDAQPEMVSVKKVIAFSEEEMPKEGRENRLSNWFVDVIMDKVSDMSGKNIDVGICNFGGIRSSMPKGPVSLDDIKSMFPFKNYLVYLELPGKILRELFENMAAVRFEVLGGVEITVEDRKIVSAEIGGEPIDDERMYSVATITFLLHGGDGLSLAEGASNLVVYDVAVADAVLEHIYSLTTSGRSISGSDVRHVVIK